MKFLSIKSFLTLSLCLSSLVLVLPSCEKDKPSNQSNTTDTTPHAKMAFEQSEYTIPVKGAPVQLVLKNIPEKYKNSVKYISNNPAIVTVDAQGMVMAQDVGEAYVTAKAGSAIASCKIIAQLPQEYNLSFEQKMMTVKAGETFSLQLLENKEPYKRPFKVEWISSDKDVMTVDQNGRVTAVAFGSGVIGARVLNGNKNNYAYIQVQVNDDAKLVEVDRSYIDIPFPFPYLKFPASKEEIMAAERQIMSGGLVLRKLIADKPEEGGREILYYHLRDFLGYGPGVTMFGNVFYFINANTSKGEPFCVAYAWGVQNEDQINVLGSAILQDAMGYTELKKLKISVPGSDIQMDAYRAVNPDKNISVLIYLKDNPEDKGLKMGVLEWRKLEGDPYSNN